MNAAGPSPKRRHISSQPGCSAPADAKLKRLSVSVMLGSLLEAFGAPSRRLIRLRMLPAILHNRAAKL